MDGPRACRECEFDEVISLLNEIFRPGSEQDILTDYPLVFNHSMLEYMRVVSVDGVVVAQVPVIPREVIAAGDRFTVGIISPTATHPDHRHKGYSTLCLQDCNGIMEEKGWAVSALWTMEGTFPFYQHSGYEAVASQGWMYRLDGEQFELFEPGPWKIVPYEPAGGHLDAIMKIHEAEAYRIGRTREEYQTLLSLPKINVFLAVKNGEATGYLLFGEGTNKPGLIEGGGDVGALESLVRYVLEQRVGGGQTQVLTPLTPTCLGRLMEVKAPQGKRPVEEADGVGPQMMRINSLERLLRGIENYLRGKSAGLRGDVRLVCEETGEAVTVEFHDGDVRFSDRRIGDEVVLGRRRLVQLIFGAHRSAEPVECNSRAGEILRAVFPYYFPIWELDHS